MKKVLSLMSGFNYSLSTNANAICLYKIIKADKSTFYVVITDIHSDSWVESPENLKMVYYDFSAWKKPWKLKKIIDELTEVCFNLMNDWYHKNVFLISFPNINLHLGTSLRKKDQKVLLYLYELDPFAYNKGFRSQKVLFFIRRNIESRAFHVANNIFLTHELYKDYTKLKYPKFASKMIELAQPTIDEEVYQYLSSPSSEDEKIVFAYFGTINNSFRNPNEYLEDFCSVLDVLERPYEIRFYGSDEKFLTNILLNCTNYNIKVLPFVSQEKYLDVLSETNFLINISNKNIGDVIPSKLLEYIGTGLPIINFADNSHNVTVNVLKDYPFNFNFYSNKDKNFYCESLFGFIYSKFKKRARWDLIQEKYSEFISKSVVQKMNFFIK